jgi:hypothetical protein
MVLRSVDEVVAEGIRLGGLEARYAGPEPLKN